MLNIIVEMNKMGASTLDMNPFVFEQEYMQAQLTGRVSQVNFCPPTP